MSALDHGIRRHRRTQRHVEQPAAFWSRLVPQSERPLAQRVLEAIRPRLDDIPGLKVYLQNQPALRIGGFVSKSEFQYALLDADMDELVAWVPKIVDRLNQSGAVVDVNTNLILDNPKVQIIIDRERASRMGISADQIEQALFTAYGARQRIDDLRVHRPIRSDHGAAARVPAQCGCAGATERAQQQRRTRAVARVGRVQARVGPTDDFTRRPTAVGNDFLQPCARQSAWRCGYHDRSDDGRTWRAGYVDRPIPGHGAGVPVFVGGYGCVALRSRLRRSIWCWAFFTKAPFTP